MSVKELYSTFIPEVTIPFFYILCVEIQNCALKFCRSTFLIVTKQVPWPGLEQIKSITQAKLVCNYLYSFGAVFWS